MFALVGEQWENVEYIKTLVAALVTLQGCTLERPVASKVSNTGRQC